MAELRCNHCVHLQQRYCNKLNESVPDTLTKLFLGGAEAIYSGAVNYPSKCGIEKENGNVEMGVLIPETLSQQNRKCQH